MIITCLVAASIASASPSQSIVVDVADASRDICCAQMLFVAARCCRAATQGVSVAAAMFDSLSNAVVTSQAGCIQ